MTELPEGWTIASLSEVFEFNPRKPPTDAIGPEAPVTFVPMAAVDATTGTIAQSKTQPFLTVRKGYTAFRDADVILAKITPCFENGKVAVARQLVNGFGFGSSEFHVFRPTGAVLPEYLFHFLRQKSFRDEAAAHMTGTAGQARVPADYLKMLELPVSPLDEQHRIVEKIDVLLHEIDRARAHLARAPSLLKRFRQAVLAAANSGRLTEDWRATQLQVIGGDNGQIPPSIDDAGHDAALPAGWSRVRIGEIAECLDHKRKPVNRDERSLRLGNIPYFGANGQVGWIDSHLFDEDLVLVVEDETFIGRQQPFSYVVRGRSWVNNHAHVLRPRDGMTVEYLNTCLAYYDFVPLTSGTTGRRKLTKFALMNATLQVAPPLEQIEIARRVQDLFILAETIERRVIVASNGARNLTQSILARAFRGELVPTEAELAAKEHRDFEPAPTLLKRIQSNRTQAELTRPRRRRRPSLTVPG